MKTCQTFIKQSTQKRGIESYKMDGSKSKQKEETTNQGGFARGTRSNQVLNSPRTQGAYEIRREEEHLKEHLT